MKKQFCPQGHEYTVVGQLANSQCVACSELPRKQFLEACHYTNLQPLTIPDHKKKTAENKKLRVNNEK